MRRIQIKWLKTYNAIIIAVLGMLGFTSCEEPRDEYGTPSATFIVQGKVTDKSNNQPIENIQVEVGWRNSVYTNSDGKYEFSIGEFPESQTFPISFRDVDDDLNGSYMDLDTIVEFKDPKFTGGKGNWYEGVATKEFNIQLNPKE